MTTTERYAALRALYLHWFAQSKYEYHFQMASYAGGRFGEGE